jgi:hypothetical protein
MIERTSAKRMNEGRDVAERMKGKETSSLGGISDNRGIVEKD